MRTQPIAWLVLAAAIFGCSGPTGPVAHGQWGGTEASLSLARSGGTLGYACGEGTIDSGWTVTAGGQFRATGQHFFGGGPLPSQGHPPHPARYAGYLHGSRLTLTVILLDLPDTLGPFHLTRGGPWVTVECL